MNYEAKVVVRLKQSVNDPQGNAVRQALHTLGFRAVTDARIGRFISLSLEAGNQSEAQEMVESMCGQLLANPVIEAYTIDLDSKSSQV